MQLYLNNKRSIIVDYLYEIKTAMLMIHFCPYTVNETLIETHGKVI